MANPYITLKKFGRETGASNQINAPAIALIVVSVIALVAGVIGLVADVVFLVSGLVEKLEAVNKGPISKYTEITIRMIWGAGLLIASSFVLYGAINMKNLKNYSSARLASILAMIPLVGPCCILGIPFGIWAFIALAKPGVRQSFS